MWCIQAQWVEVTLMKFFVFYAVVLGIFNTTFSRKPHENWLTWFLSEIQADGFAKQ